MPRRFLSILAAVVSFTFVLMLFVNIGEAAKKVSLTKIESSDKKAVIKCPKDAFMLAQNTGNRIENEVPTITTEVYFSQTMNVDTYVYHTFASDIFKISVADETYRLSEQGELTLAYVKSISTLVADRLSVWYSEEKDFSGCEPKKNCLGGYVNAGSCTITVPFQIKGKEVYYAVLLDQREPDFRDNWSYSNVIPLWSKEIMKTNDKNIDNDIKRREFAFMMVRGLGLPLIEDKNETFSDTPSSDEDFFLIEAAARYGIINGFPNNGDKPLFKPDDLLTREQTAAIIARVANLKLQTDVDKVQKNLKKIFPDDGDKISPWAASSVLAVCEAKFMGGYKNDQGKITEFKPGSYLKRSEAAKVTFLLFKKLKKI